MNPDYSANSSAGPFSPIDIDQIPENPQRGSHHRRAHSEVFFRLPDDLLSDFDFPPLDFPSANAAALEAPTTVDSCKSDDSSSDNKGGVGRPPPSSGHLRSLSVDAGFFDGLAFGTPVAPVPAGGRRAGLHRRNSSMDGSAASSFEGDSLMDGLLKKTMAPEKLAELALMDPKRAKRILANRQSAARSKERKIYYTNELERKVQTLQTEATTLSAQVTMLQRDTNGLTTENRELKLRLQAMDQQAHLRDALNEALREEVHRLRIATGQVPPSNSFSSMHIQQPRFNPSQPTANGQNCVKQHQQGFLDYNRRV